MNFRRAIGLFVLVAAVTSAFAQGEIAEAFARFVIRTARGEEREVSAKGADEISRTLRTFGKGDRVIVSGTNVPEELLEASRLRDVELVHHSAQSANQDAADIARAAALGERSLKSSRIFNGLPDPQGFFGGIREMWRMDRPTSEMQDWQNLQLRINSTLAGSSMTAEKATRNAFLTELQSGNQDVVFLMAHNDGKTIYLPNGGRLTREDLEGLRRNAAPDRVVVLITCSAGGVNGAAPSWSEILLRNKLAKTVFASPRPVNAMEAPALLQELTAPVSLRQTLQKHQFVQIVRLLKGSNEYPA